MFVWLLFTYLNPKFNVQLVDYCYLVMCQVITKTINNTSFLSALAEFRIPLVVKFKEIRKLSLPKTRKQIIKVLGELQVLTYNKVNFKWTRIEHI